MAESIAALAYSRRFQRSPFVAGNLTCVCVFKLLSISVLVAGIEEMVGSGLSRAFMALF